MWNPEEQDMHTSFVVGCALDNEKLSGVAFRWRVLSYKLIDKPVLVVDSTAPVAIPVAEWLWRCPSPRSIDSMDSRSTRWFTSDQNGSGTSVTTSNGSLRRMTNWRKKRRTALDMSSPAFSKRASASCRSWSSTRICSVDVAILQSLVVQNGEIVPLS